jgi:hypothetical protein
MLPLVWLTTAVPIGVALWVLAGKPGWMRLPFVSGRRTASDPA